MEGAAADAWSGLAPSVGACFGRESGEAGVGGCGKPCLEAEMLSMPLLLGPLTPDMTDQCVSKSKAMLPLTAAGLWSTS